MVREDSISITPLGGVGYVGQNCFLYTSGNYSVVVDCGIKPLTCEEKNMGQGWGEPPPCLNILDEGLEKGGNAIGIITHAHLDHIGAVASFGKRGIPTYLSRPAKAFMERYAENLRIPCGSRFYTFYHIATLKHGDFDIILVPFPHSIPGTYGVLMRVEGKKIIHLSDFKFNGVEESIEITKQTLRDIRDISGGIDCLMFDVLNSDLPGFTPPEQMVFDSIDDILSEEKGRVVITFFSSNLDRMRGIIDLAQKHSRKVRLAGWGMINSYAMLLRKDGRLFGHDWNFLAVGGSQGEDSSALSRMARGEHQIKLRPGDTVIFASRRIPGNEEPIRRNLERLHEMGVRIVLHEGETEKLGLPFPVREMFLHVSGHEQMGGLAEVVKILEPGLIVPIHAPDDRVGIFESNIGKSVRRLQVGETLEI